MVAVLNLTVNNWARALVGPTLVLALGIGSLVEVG